VTVVRAALFIIASAIILAIAGPVTRTLPASWSPAAVGLMTSAATFAITVLFTRWNGITLSDVGARATSGTGPRLALGFLIGLGLAGAQSLAVSLSGHVQLVRVSDVSLAAFGIALLTYGALACREELAFRGYPLRSLDRAFGPWIAQCLVALVFALEHVAGGYSWTNALLGVTSGSILFGMAALATRGLALPIGLHAAWNFGQWTLGGKETPGFFRAVTDNGFHDKMERVGMISYLGIMTAATFGFWLVYRKLHRKTNARTISAEKS
jgi:membrane protease YdiL (CAAX protease family)